MNVTQTLSDQARNPTGAIGRVMARAMPVLFGSLYRRVARLLDLQREDDVLDVACGSGVFLKRYAAHAHRVAGVDHSQLQVALARRWNRERVAAGSAEFVVGDTTALPWHDDTFSAVTCNCVECFADPLSALQEMRRVLRPGGRAVVVVAGADPGGRRQPGEVDRWGLVTRSESDVRRLMAEAGFPDVVVSMDHGGWCVEARKQ